MLRSRKPSRKFNRKNLRSDFNCMYGNNHVSPWLFPYMQLLIVLIHRLFSPKQLILKLNCLLIAWPAA